MSKLVPHEVIWVIARTAIVRAERNREDWGIKGKSFENGMMIPVLQHRFRE
jgi:hypothetical protein